MERYIIGRLNGRGSEEIENETVCKFEAFLPSY